MQEPTLPFLPVATQVDALEGEHRLVPENRVTPPAIIRTFSQILVALPAEVLLPWLRTDRLPFLFRFGCSLERGMWRLELPESHGIPVTHVPRPFLASG